MDVQIAVVWPVVAAYLFSYVMPKIIDAWEKEMRDLEYDDREEYELFQKNLSDFFITYQNKNISEGFEKI